MTTMIVELTVSKLQEEQPRLARYASHHLEPRIIRSMTKTLDVIKDVLRSTKHPFHQLADRPDKPHKNRYERRKIKQFLQQNDWRIEEQPT